MAFIVMDLSFIGSAELDFPDSFIKVIDSDCAFELEQMPEKIMKVRTSKNDFFIYLTELDFYFLRIQYKKFFNQNVNF